MTIHAGGGCHPAPDGTHEPSGAGWIPCAICTDPISLDQYRTARCWTDPQANTIAAHAACLIRIGEHELSLPPDPGENTAVHGATP